MDSGHEAVYLHCCALSVDNSTWSQTSWGEPEHVVDSGHEAVYLHCCALNVDNSTWSQTSAKGIGM